MSKLLPILFAIFAIAVVIFRNWLDGCLCLDRADLTGKVVIVTGATNGLGLETAKALFSMGAHVIMPCRDLLKGQKISSDIKKEISSDGSVVAMQMDLSSLDSVSRFVEEFNDKYEALHILINNAGEWPYKHSETQDSLQQTFQVNHLSHFLLVARLLPKLRAGGEVQPSRIVTLSSGLHHRGELVWDEIEAGRVMPVHSFSGFHAYANSKLLNVIFASELQRRVTASDTYAGRVLSVSVHPGVIRTSLHREDKLHQPWFFAAYSVAVSLLGKSVSQGAQTTICAAVAGYTPAAPAAKGRGGGRRAAPVGGEYWADCAAAPAHPAAGDAGAGERLWRASGALLRRAGADPGAELGV